MLHQDVWSNISISKEKHFKIHNYLNNVRMLLYVWICLVNKTKMVTVLH